MPDPAPALRALVNALPEDRLRDLVFDLLLVDLAAPVPAAAPATKRPRGWPKGKPRGPRSATKTTTRRRRLTAQQRERDVMRKREKRAERAAARRAAAAAVAGEKMGAPVAAVTAIAATPAQQAAVKPRRSDPGLARAKRSAAAALGRSRKKHRTMVEAAKAAAKAANGSSNGGDHIEIDKTMPTPASTAQAPTARALWEHAERLEPKRPWKFVADEFGINPQQTLDAYRVHRLPPGITEATVTRFLELPVS